MSPRTFRVLLIAIGSLLSAGANAAQSPPDNTVSAAAAVTVRSLPTKLRMQIELRSYGKTPEVALQNLAARRAAAVARLRQLKADAASVSCGIPRVEAATPAAYGAPTINGPTSNFVPGASPYTVPPAYSAPPPAAPGWAEPPRPVDGPAPAPKPATKKAVPRLYVASGSLRADWRLEAGDADRLAAAAARIPENVKAADLAGAAVAQKLTPEEKEAVEEFEMRQMPPTSSPYVMPDSPTGSVPPALGTAPALTITTSWGVASRSPAPTFVFVATLSAAERKATIAKAFALAKADVETLAEAAGMKVGPIARLEPISIAGALVTPQSSPSLIYDGGGNGSSTTYKNYDEDTAADAGGTSFTVAVSLTCHLLPPK
jgi:hypothetical protein